MCEHLGVFIYIKVLQGFRYFFQVGEQVVESWLQ